MIVKRKLYSVMDEEGNQGYYLYNESTGEEKLFSVEDDEKDSSKKSKIRTAGKIAALSGTAGSLGIAIPTAYKLNKLQNEVADKVAKKYNVRNAGGLFIGNKAVVTKAVKVYDRVGRRVGNNRLVKAGGKAADALAGAAILGTGAYLYGRYKDNKKKSK